MDGYQYKDGILHVEQVPLPKIAEAFGTPVYVYSKSMILQRCQDFLSAFKEIPTLPCYAVKANSNLSILKIIFNEGFGAEVVSVGELERALRAGAKPERILFSGVGKRDDEIERAINVGVLAVNAESTGEIERIRHIAKRLGVKARLSLRINPDIDAKTNPHIATGLYSTKFGLAENDAILALASLRNVSEIEVVGISCHIGSQITEIGPFEETAKRMATLAQQVLQMGHKLSFVNLGGGLGIRYSEETPPSFSAYAKTLMSEVKNLGLKLLLEPGRVLVGNSGVMLTRVIGVKKTPKKTFVVLDGGMNDLIRPCLYDAYHDIQAVNASTGKSMTADIVGPICETTDTFGQNRNLSEVKTGDLVVIRECGAYGASMGSQYNGRPRPPEVLVLGGDFRLIRERESLEALWNQEIRFL